MTDDVRGTTTLGLIELVEDAVGNLPCGDCTPREMCKACKLVEEAIAELKDRVRHLHVSRPMRPRSWSNSLKERT